MFAWPSTTTIRRLHEVGRRGRLSDVAVRQAAASLAVNFRVDGRASSVSGSCPDLSFDVTLDVRGQVMPNTEILAAPVPARK
jgi:hypothetical protein